MEWLLGWLNAAIQWVFGIIKAGLLALLDLLRDGVVWVFDQVLGAVASVISAIPVPAFMQSGGLGGLFGAIPPEVAWFVGQLGLPQAAAMIGAGVMFRLTRKLVTLGQW